MRVRSRGVAMLATFSMVCAAGTLGMGAATAGASGGPPMNVPISSSGLGSFAGPWITVDPTNANHLAVAYGEGSQKQGCYLATSDNGGLSWNAVVVIGQGGLQPLPSPTTLCTFPSAQFGPDGTLYYAFSAIAPLPPPVAGSNRGNYRIYVITSTNGGSSFGSPVAANTTPIPTTSQGGDYLPAMAVDSSSGQLYVAWEQQIFPPTGSSFVNTFMSTSTDHGQSFAAPVSVVPVQPTLFPHYGLPRVTVGPDGTVYVASSAVPVSGSTENLQVVASTNHGLSFGAAVNAISNINLCNTPPNGGACSTALSMNSDASDLSPQIIAGPTPGLVYAATQELIGSSFKIVFTLSHNGGQTWSSPGVVGVPPGLTQDNQLFPNLSIAPNGRIDIVYYDLVEPASTENTYVTSSSDGGNTWSTPQLVSSVPSNTLIYDGPAGFFDNGPFGGGRLGVSSNDAIYTVWTDSRRGTVATGKTDVFGATVLMQPAGGYRLAGSDGSLLTFGDAGNAGSVAGENPPAPIVGVASTPGGAGYWLVGADGSVYPFGTAARLGELLGHHLNAPIVGIAATPDGGGYWLVAADGGIFAFGDARYFGSLGNVHLNQPIVGMASTPDGGGYWLVAADGGVFTFGDAPFEGSLGASHLTAPIVGIASTPDGGGYWLAASNGQVFNLGDASSFGSAGQLTARVVGISATVDGNGYWLVGADGSVLTFGDANGVGSAAGTHLGGAIVGMATTP